jgi:hypothetical protein
LLPAIARDHPVDAFAGQRLEQAVCREEDRAGQTQPQNGTRFDKKGDE